MSLRSSKSDYDFLSPVITSYKTVGVGQEIVELDIVNP